MTKHVRVIKEKAQFQACGTNGNQSAGASPRNGQKSVKLCRTSAENWQEKARVVVDSIPVQIFFDILSRVGLLWSFTTLRFFYNPWKFSRERLHFLQTRKWCNIVLMSRDSELDCLSSNPRSATHQLSHLDISTLCGAVLDDDNYGDDSCNRTHSMEFHGELHGIIYIIW